MAVPKRRKSKSARDMRRAQYKITAVSSVLCPQCGEAKLPHCICRACGYYKGRAVIVRAEQPEAQ